MKHIAFFTMLMLFVFSAGAKQKMDYKCYIETTNGFEVGMYAWNVKKYKTQMAKLVGKPSHRAGKVKGYIKKVEECVLVQVPFTKKAAQELDKKTLK